MSHFLEGIMTKDGFDSAVYDGSSEEPNRFPAWVKLTAIATASALAGGLAAVWIYRKTLRKLQNAAEDPETSIFHRQNERANEDS